MIILWNARNLFSSECYMLEKYWKEIVQKKEFVYFFSFLNTNHAQRRWPSQVDECSVSDVYKWTFTAFQKQL